MKLIICLSEGQMMSPLYILIVTFKALWLQTEEIFATKISISKSATKYNGWPNDMATRWYSCDFCF